MCVAMKVFYITFALSVVLLICGFLLPPTGVIDGSVLKAVGELLMFSVIARIPEAIKAGKSVKIQKGDSSVEISNE